MRLAYNSNDPGMDDMPAGHDPAQHGLALIAALSMGEFFSIASLAQARGFYRAVGVRLAAHNPIPPMRDLREMEGAVNAVWARLGLGYAAITLDVRGVLIHHQDMLGTIEGDGGAHWPDALPSLLEGAYDGWLRAMGSPEALTTRIEGPVEGSIESPGEQTIAIRHGAPDA